MRMLQTIRFPGKREAAGMLQDPVQQRSGENWIAHHLCPVSNLFVGRKDQGGCLVGIADKGKEPVGLSPGNRSISDFINQYQLSLLQFEREPGQ